VYCNSCSFRWNLLIGDSISAAQLIPVVGTIGEVDYIHIVLWLTLIEYIAGAAKFNYDKLSDRSYKDRSCPIYDKCSIDEH